ncbi:MAG: LptA/OstA family protein [Acidobacteriota bacterium]|nr:LptA/OstA family protein [Acidobacteriota bacterium]
MAEKPASSSRPRNRLGIALVIAVILLVVFFARSLFVEKKRADAADTGVGDRGISYLAFNEESKKSIEVKCQESFTTEADELRLKNISGVIYKSGRMNKDIRFFGDQGIAKDDFNSFQITGNARIVSEDITFKAESFLMIGKKNLLSRGETSFTGTIISGKAAQGIEILFELNEFKFFGVVGDVTKGRQKYAFASPMLWMFRNDNWLALKGKSSIQTGDALLTADEIILRFSEEFVDLQSYVSIGNSILHSEKSIPGGRADEREILDIAANKIESIFNETGDLERIMVFEEGRLAVAGNADRCEMSGDNIDCWLFPQTQSIREIFIRTPGGVKIRGSQEVDLSADEITAKYDENGGMQDIHAEQNGQFTFGDFKGSAPELHLDAGSGRLVIGGGEARITCGANLFAGSAFEIDTKKTLLSAPSGVRATVSPEKGSVLFHAAPLYLSADNLVIGDNGRNITFKNKVQLFQDEIKLTAGEINFNNDANLIAARGRVHLEFVSEKDLLVLEGGSVVFDSGSRQIAAEGNARLRQTGNTLAAGKIILFLSGDERLEKVSAQRTVEFANDRISGKSELLDWQFDKKILVFRKEARISKKNSGMTRGQELHLNLESNEITVSGADDRSETTILRDRP